MTNNQALKEWDNYLAKMFGCYADEVGNRPCDNGACCDRCAGCGKDFWEMMEGVKV